MSSYPNPSPKSNPPESKFNWVQAILITLTVLAGTAIFGVWFLFQVLSGLTPSKNDPPSTNALLIRVVTLQDGFALELEIPGVQPKNKPGEYDGGHYRLVHNCRTNTSAFEAVTRIYVPDKMEYKRKPDGELDLNAFKIIDVKDIMVYTPADDAILKGRGVERLGTNGYKMAMDPARLEFNCHENGFDFHSTDRSYTSNKLNSSEGIGISEPEGWAISAANGGPTNGDMTLMAFAPNKPSKRILLSGESLSVKSKNNPIEVRFATGTGADPATAPLVETVKAISPLEPFSLFLKTDVGWQTYVFDFNNGNISFRTTPK